MISSSALKKNKAKTVPPSSNEVKRVQNVFLAFRKITTRKTPSIIYEIKIHIAKGIRSRPLGFPPPESPGTAIENPVNAISITNIKDPSKDMIHSYIDNQMFGEVQINK